MGDSEEAGVAVSLCYLPDEERTLHTPFRTDGDHPQEDPIEACRAFQASCEDDFPGSLWAIASNQHARDIMTNRRMRAMGFDDYDHAKEEGP